MIGKKYMNTGDLVKKMYGHLQGQLGLVVAEGADEYQTVLASWIRIRYLNSGGYEWIKKHGVELITKH